MAEAVAAHVRRRRIATYGDGHQTRTFVAVTIHVEAPMRFRLSARRNDPGGGTLRSAPLTFRANGNEPPELLRTLDDKAIERILKYTTNTCEINERSK